MNEPADDIWKDLKQAVAWVVLIAVVVIALFSVVVGVGFLGGELRNRNASNGVQQEHDKAQKAVYQTCRKKALIGIIEPGCPGVTP